MVSDMSFVQTSSGAAAAAGTFVNIGASMYIPSEQVSTHLNGGIQRLLDSKVQWVERVDWSPLKRLSNAISRSYAIINMRSK
jgi:hypothetical protein